MAHDSGKLLRGTGLPRKAVVGAVTLAAIMLAGRPAHAQDALSFFKNYFVTGGYKVGGVGLVGQGVDGIAQGNILIEGVPDGAEIVAAFLYAQVVSDAGGNAAGAGITFHGVPLSTPDGTFGVIGDPLGATPCWSGGGGTGQSGGSKRTYSLRFDALRFLPVVDGRHQANGFHPVELPDLGNSNATPIALGASLVLIYRDPEMPLSAFVIYDGSAAMDNATQGMTQTIEGFYDPASVPGELTHIVGSGQANKFENLRVNGNIVSVNPFQALEGEAWDNVTVATPDLLGMDSLTTSVDNVGFPSFDCLTWSAVIYRTEVNDLDLDGLLDRWETDSGLTDPNGLTLPDLRTMGADPFHKDIFVEAGYMFTDPTTSNAGDDADDGVLYGGVLKPHHTHLPTAAAIEKVVDAFAASPVVNFDLTTGINLHFDVGTNHQGVPGVILVADGARGGEAFDEMITVCVPGDEDPPFVCQFSGYPGTLGWKTGFQTLRDALVTTYVPDIAPGDDHPCEIPGHPDYLDVGEGGACELNFDRARKDIFRYAFFPHLLGVPKAHCLHTNEFLGDPPDPTMPDPNFGLPDETCQLTDPLFHVPNTYTGIGDFGGADFAVTMGGFDNAAGEPVGTDNQTAGTIMHELGHTVMLRHGGLTGNPNCAPNYLSVMNYLYQLRGLKHGVLAVDYSGEALADLNESSLFETTGLGGFPLYAAAWYAPFAGIGTPVARHCVGTTPLAGEQAMVRLEGTQFGGPIDWNGDGDNILDNPVQFLPGITFQDVNFDGLPNDVNAPLAGFNDWASLRLNQIGARRNIGVYFFADGFPYIGPASLGMTGVDYGKFDFGKFDFGKFDFGKFDFGKFDFGKFDFGKFDFGDLNMGDLGKFDFGKFDFGKFDFGKFDFGAGAGDLGRGADGKGGFGKFDFGKFDFGGGGDDGTNAELTTALAVAAGLLGPPANLAACVAGHPGDPACVEQDGDLRVELTWGTPDASPTAYVIYRRVAGETDFTEVSPVGGVLATTFDDTSNLAFDTTYNYYVAARYITDGVDPTTGLLVQIVSESASNIVTVTIAPQFYILVPDRNLPPRRQNTGSAVPVEWHFTLNGVDAFDSSDANPVVTLVSEANGILLSFSPDDIDPGSSGFKLPTVDNGFTWQLNLQLAFPDPYLPNPGLAGTDLPGGTDYRIIIGSEKMEQPFVSATFEVRAAKGGKK